MKTLLRFIALSSAIAPLSFATPAAADPRPEAQSKMAQALSACDRGLEPDGDASRSLADYKRLSSEAKALDPSIASWKGKLHGVWVVDEQVGKCERDLPAKAREGARVDTLRPAWSAAAEACDQARRELTPEALAAYRRSRAALASANQGSATFSLPERQDATQRIAKCDAELPPAIAEAEKKRARERAQDERQKAEADAAKARTAAIWASLKGDRLAIAKDYGLPLVSEPARAPRWVYERSVVVGQTTIETSRGGSATAEHTIPCTVTFTFQGDKRVATTASRKGCER